MPLTIPRIVLEQVAEYFDPRSFARGAQYARDGRVMLVNADWPAVAQVRGTVGYITTVYYSNRTLPNRDMHGTCSCPMAIDCKHVVATALVALMRDDHRLESWELAHKQEVVGEWLSGMSIAIDHAASSPSRHAIVYVLAGDRSVGLTVERTTRLKRGGFGKSTPLSSIGDPTRGLPGWAEVDDVRMVSMLRAISRVQTYATRVDVRALHAELFEELAATERLFWGSCKSPPLRYGPPKTARMRWSELADAPGEHRVELNVPLICVAALQPHYIDPAAAVIGPLELGAPATIVRGLYEGPPIPDSMMPTVRRSLRPVLAGTPASDLVGEPEPELDLLRPHLFVSADPHRREHPFVDYRTEAVYGDERFELAEWEHRRSTPRDMLGEARFRDRLQRLEERHRYDYTLSPAQAALAEARFAAHHLVPQLIEEGWVCEIAEDFPVDPLPTPTEWIEELVPVERERSWFGFELGVVVDGETVSLLPMLLEAIRNGALPLDRQIFEAPDLPGLNVELPSGAQVYVSGRRLQRWLRPLLELQLRGLDDESNLRIPDYVAVRVAEADPGRFSKAAALAEARDRMETLLDLPSQTEAVGFGTELRSYQRQGLAWLRFLHECGYGGLLADDMGLGKTVQVLAFLHFERAAAEQRPALVVAPRSVVGHWESEANRFAPELAPVLHLGAKRSRDRERLQSSPLIITSYQTMLRDAELLAGIDWCSVFFDEAQAVKNPRTKLRRAAAALRAQSRFCMTGTPIENHLGELWSQMDLVMPGLLGNRSTFGAVFRRPIEKHGADVVLEHLQQRIRPFMLRRTKDTVELELPDKIEIVERVNLGDEQRDLYEGLRLSLEPVVRRALADKSLPGSSLTVLDALLKLRQLCCHPRLVDLPEARKHERSAKLDRLMSMLEELADAGRYALVFSQFTSMLDIIAAACRDADIPYLELTGSTRNREAVIRKFQSGEAPVFLISLKAGGTGLNLTRADTVIHYDPWWNPAAELQATDRAHRIGQDKNVFVYKMVTQGTLEERIIELQNDKRALTDATLRNGGAEHLSKTDLEALYRILV